MDSDTINFGSDSIYLRYLKLEDLDNFYQLNLPHREHHKFNAPYFKKRTQEELDEYVESLRLKLISGKTDVLKQKKVIAHRDSDEIIGTVNWYWHSQVTNWMRIGIIIFNDKYWGRGIGPKALTLWINEIFEENTQLVRLGLTTWSGNKRMMALAEKLGFKKEAQFRNARVVDGKFYDSVSFGILKEEWIGQSV